MSITPLDELGSFQEKIISKAGSDFQSEVWIDHTVSALIAGTFSLEILS